MSATVPPSRAATQHVALPRRQRVTRRWPAPRRPGRGRSTRSPASTARIAAASSATGASFTRKPDAPASIARRRKPGRPKVVRMSTRQVGQGWRSARGGLDAVHARASRCPAARRRGRCSGAAATTTSPRPTSATTSRSSSRSSSAAQRAADQGLVLGEQQPDRPEPPSARSRRHASAAQPEPAAAAGPASSRPPTAVTRSRSPARPSPIGGRPRRAGPVVDDLDAVRA